MAWLISPGPTEKSIGTSYRGDAGRWALARGLNASSVDIKLGGSALDESPRLVWLSMRSSCQVSGACATSAICLPCVWGMVDEVVIDIFRSSKNSRTDFHSRPHLRQFNFNSRFYCASDHPSLRTSPSKFVCRSVIINLLRLGNFSWNSTLSSPYPKVLVSCSRLMLAIISTQPNKHWLGVERRQSSSVKWHL